ncbi:hypothetical protein Tco_0178838 [Tanacetum coccineum]
MLKITDQTSASSSTSDIHPFPSNNKKVLRRTHSTKTTPIIHIFFILHITYLLLGRSRFRKQSSSGNVNSAFGTQPKTSRRSLCQSTEGLEEPGKSYSHVYRLKKALLYGLKQAPRSRNTMAEQNVPAQPPTRTDEQIVPRSQWLTIGKSNLLFNAQKIQKNPIFQISVDILSNTNFFQAFTASANVPAIYLQQFWKTMSYNEKTGVYSCQVDEQWFDLSADLLRKALAITPVNPAQPFELPPSGNTVIDFVNELGYPEPVEIVSNIRVNYVYQPWRAILSLINQCLTGKTSGSDKPRHPVLQMLWGIVTQNYVNAELIWEVFTQGIDIFHTTSKSHPFPYTEAIQQSSYYSKYLEMVAENTKKTPQESASVKPAIKRAIPKKPTTTTPVKHPKHAPPSTKKLILILKKKGDDLDLKLDKMMSLKSHQENEKAKEDDDADMDRAIASLALGSHAFLPQGRAPVGGVTIRDPVSETTSKLHEVVGKGKAMEDAMDMEVADKVKDHKEKHDSDVMRTMIAD